MNTRILLVVAALAGVLFVFTGVSDAAAPPWHHHHDDWHHGWHPHPPIVVGPPVIFRPPFVIRPPVVIQPPVVVTPPTAVNYPPSNPPPVVAANIQIVNPSGVTLSYLLNGQQAALAAGMTQQLAQGAVIEFDRGNGLGTARYTLTDGVYTFTAAADGGWDLAKS